MNVQRSKLKKGSLCVEMIPTTSFYANLRSALKRSQWDKLRRECYVNANYKCEVCGGKGKRHPVECHERWGFDYDKRLQILEGLIALCPDCHAAVHFGLTEMRGYADHAIRKLKSVNKWTDRQTHQHIQEACDRHELQSQIEWEIDLSWLHARGIYAEAKLK